MNSKKSISGALLITLLLSICYSAQAQPLKCLSKTALSAALTVSKITLEGLEKSLPEQLKAAQKIKSKLAPAITDRTLAYNKYKANPTPENKKIYDKKNLAYQSLNTTYQLQYDLYLGQKKRIPSILTEISNLKIKITSLDKECTVNNKP
jgi:hypothetical protein